MTKSAATTPPNRKTRNHKLAGALAALSTAAAVHGQTILYVDDDAPGGNGRSWNEAFNDLQDALWLASLTWGPTEIRIAEGIYKPDRGTGNQTASFTVDHVSSGMTLGFGIVLKGAFAGITALDPNERDKQRFKSVLSGDLNGDDQRNFGRTEENSHHIFRLVDTQHDSVEFDGLVFQGGNAAGAPGGRSGAALFVSQRQNTTTRVFIVNCTFLDNRSIYGGAIFLNSQGATTWILNSFFGNNRAEAAGGAVRNSFNSDTYVSNCVFAANFSELEGGAIDDRGQLQVYESTFYGNASNLSGGAISASGLRLNVSNSILFSNGTVPISRTNNTRIVFSCIEGGFTGAGNISTDPSFTDPAGPDGTLGTPDDNYLPRFGSPVIDAGWNDVVYDPSGLDFAGQRRMVDDRFTPDTGSGIAPMVDMGAYEFQLPDCYADLDHSTGVGVLDLFDFLRFQSLFVMNDPLACQVDRSTGANICDIFDFLAFQFEFGAGCP